MPEPITVTQEELLEMSSMLSEYSDSIPFDQDRLFQILRYARQNDGPWGHGFRINLANRHLPTESMAHLLCRLVARGSLYISEILRLRETEQDLRSQLDSANSAVRELTAEISRLRAPRVDIDAPRYTSSSVDFVIDEEYHGNTYRDAPRTVQFRRVPPGVLNSTTPPSSTLEIFD